MKRFLYFFTCLALLSSSFLTSCNWGKKIAAPKDRTITTKNSGNTPSPTAKDAVSEPKKAPVAAPKEPKATPAPASKTAPVDNVIRETPKEASYSPLPSKEAENAFIASFPTAQTVVWTKNAPTVKGTESTGNGFKVNFTILDNKNTAIYSENGQLLEAREQILPEQLPPNIYNAIKNKYPNGIIVSATSVKYSVVKATYAAIIKAHPEAAQTEVILSESGTFIK